MMGPVSTAPLLVAGTFLPLIGLVVTLAGALATRGGRRWLVLAAIPAATMVVCALVAEPVFGDGNRLAATLYILFALVLAIYYPVLAFAWLIRSRRRAAGH